MRGPRVAPGAPWPIRRRGCRHYASVLLLLVACQDYDLDEKGDPAPIETGTPPGDSRETEETAETADSAETGDTATPPETGDSDPPCTLDLPGASLATDVSTCPELPVADPWQVALRDEWYGVDSGYTYMSEQVATGNLTDDNGDGRLDTSDVPDVVIGMAPDVCVSPDTRLYLLSGPDLTEVWHVTYPYLDLHTTPAVGDVDGDGRPDIVMQTDDGTTVAFDAMGSVLWVSATTMQYNLPGITLADLDGDGDVEVMAGRAVSDGATGAIEFELGGTVGGEVVASDLDQDGEREILYWGYAWTADGDRFGDAAGNAVYAAVTDQDGNPTTGEAVWVQTNRVLVTVADWTEAWSYTAAAPLGPPTFADLDGDDRAEVIATEQGVGLLAWGPTGRLLWELPLSFEGTPGVAAADLDRDGAYELVLAGRTALYIIEGDGTIAWTSPAFPFDSTPAFPNQPVLTDLDADGSAEIAYVIEEEIGSRWLSLLLVYTQADAAWPGTARSWSQAAFTKQARLEDGTVPPWPAPSWVGEDVFRGCPSDADGKPDLRASVVDVCAEGCAPDDAVGVAVQVGNVGTVDVGEGTLVTLYANVGGTRRAIATERMEDPLPAGHIATALPFTVTAADVAGATLVAIADDDGSGRGQVDECVEGDDGDAWEDVVCP